MSWANIVTIYLKELRDSLRDRRTLISTIVVPTLIMPLLIQQFITGETSSNAGGLIRWPVTATVPLGLGLLALQGLSEIIKRVGWLQHKFEMDTHYERPLQ